MCNLKIEAADNWGYFAELVWFYLRDHPSYVELVSSAFCFLASVEDTITMGDFQANFVRPDTGINTVEGNVAGSRAATLSKKRAAEQADFEARKQKIKADSERGKLGIDSKFDTNTNVSAEEQRFRAKTVGLVTAEEFRKANAEVEKARGKRIGDEDDDNDGKAAPTKLTEEEQKKLEKERKRAKKKALKEKKKRMATLSFGADDEIDDEDVDTDGLHGDKTKSMNQYM